MKSIEFFGHDLPDGHYIALGGTTGWKFYDRRISLVVPLWSDDHHVTILGGLAVAIDILHRGLMINHRLISAELVECQDGNAEFIHYPIRDRVSLHQMVGEQITSAMHRLFLQEGRDPRDYFTTPFANSLMDHCEPPLGAGYLMVFHNDLSSVVTIIEPELAQSPLVTP